MESAGQRALAIGGVSYRSLETILRNRLDQVGEQRPDMVDVGTHSNIRDPEHYRATEVATCYTTTRPRDSASFAYGESLRGSWLGLASRMPKLYRSRSALDSWRTKRRLTATTTA